MNHYKFNMKVYINGPVGRVNAVLSMTSKGYTIDEAWELLKEKMVIEKVNMLDVKQITSAYEM